MTDELRDHLLCIISTNVIARIEPRHTTIPDDSSSRRHCLRCAASYYERQYNAMVAAFCKSVL